MLKKKGMDPVWKDWDKAILETDEDQTNNNNQADPKPHLKATATAEP